MTDDQTIAFYRNLASERGDRLLTHRLAAQRASDAIKGLLAVAALAMPGTFFATDTRMTSARESLAELERLAPSTKSKGR